MVVIKNKKECCGCHACAMVCTKHCITIQSDDKDFLYPVVDNETCTDCGSTIWWVCKNRITNQNIL